MGSADLVVGEICRRNAKVLVKHATLVARPVRDDASSGGFSDAAAAPDCSCGLWLAARCARAPRRSSKQATASLKHTRFGRRPGARLGPHDLARKPGTTPRPLRRSAWRMATSSPRCSRRVERSAITDSSSRPTAISRSAAWSRRWRTADSRLYVKQRAVVSTRYNQVSALRANEDLVGTEHINLNTAFQRPIAEVFDMRSSGRWTYTAETSTVLATTSLAPWRSFSDDLHGGW